MVKKKITCIVCPIGCKIIIETKGKNFKVLEGNKCKKGIEYSKNEALNPKRNLTSSILVVGGEWPLVSVRSSKPIPKDKIFDILKEIKKISVEAPIMIGQKIIENVAGTNISIIATKTINKK